MKDFHELFVQGLRDIYSAENQIATIMPKIIQAARNSDLKKSLIKHSDETKHELKRLEEIAHELKESFSDSECLAMQGILKEWDKVMKTHYSHEVQDAAIIGFVQKIEHYEIAVYGTLKTYAQHLKLEKLEKHLRDSLHEEVAADKRLCEIAEGNIFHTGVNTKACKSSGCC